MVQPEATFGEELRRRRLAADLTLTSMAQLVHYSKGQLSKVERGIKTPSKELARLCDSVLEADGSLAALLQQRSPDAEVGVGELGDEEVWVMSLSAGEPGWFQPMNRRQALSLGAASLSGMIISWPATASVVEKSSTLAGFRSIFDQYRQLGQVTAPGLLLPPLIVLTQTLEQLSRPAKTNECGEFLILGSRCAEYVGWLAQESGNDQAALWWTQRAVQLAAAAGDHGLAAYGLVRHALVTLYRNDARQTIDLAQQAQSREASPRIRGLAAQREAQGHALAGDNSACMRSLEWARSLLAQHTPQSDTPVIGPSNLTDSAEMVRGWCLYDLGRPRAAAEIISEQLMQVPLHAVRARTRFSVRAALAYAAAGEIDHACHIAEQTLRGVVAVDSATVASDLRALSRTLARYQRSPSVRELSPQLGVVLRTSHL